MRKTVFALGIAILTVAAVLAVNSLALAETVALKADLKGSTQVPPVNTSATGTSVVTFDTGTKQLTWEITYSGLSGPATAGHFHGPAAAGANAGVAVPIPNIATSPVKGSATLTDAQAADLLGGRYYINIHTAANPGGEIRGQVAK